MENEKSIMALAWSFARQILANALKSKKFLAKIAALVLLALTWLAAMLAEYTGVAIPVDHIQHGADKVTDAIVYILTAYVLSQSVSDATKERKAEAQE